MNENLLGSLSDLKNPDFSIGEVKFHVNVIKGMPGFDLMEKVREAMASSGVSDSLPSSRSDAEENVGKRMMAAMLSIDPVKVKSIMLDLVIHIDVKLPSIGEYQPFSKVEAILIDIIKPADYYEILVRGLCVNFTDSFQGLMDRLGLRLPQAGAANSQQ